MDALGQELSPIAENGTIISVVPSQTELLYDLDLHDQVTGITKFCIHPETWKQNKSIVGGTKNLNLEKIAGLEPSIIFANLEENTKQDIEWLMERFQVYVSDVVDVKSALRMINDIAVLTNRTQEGNQILGDIQEARSIYSKPKGDDISVVYLIWNNPMMTVGGDTFISAMLQEGGWDNCFESEKRYPEILLDDIIAEQPHAIFLSSEPFPFKGDHVKWFKEKLPKSEVLLVDGEMFSWYGSRMKKSFEYFESLREKSF